MTIIREPAVSGLFYPADPEQLTLSINHFLAGAITQDQTPKALIVPHAGYRYSGAIAASAYHLLKPVSKRIRRIILVGPSHHVGFEGIAVPVAECFATPLGHVRLDKTTINEILDLPFVQASDEAHQLEHSLEVQLPFLQTILEEFTVVPLLAGRSTPEQVASVLEQLWGGEETLIVISSDLSHYHDYASARHMDQRTSRAIEQLRPDKIDNDSACGQIPVNGLLTIAKKLGLSASTLDLRNSGDTGSSKDKVVGYGAYAFH
ncbi:MAG: AmmeMemoRadiSam system protein B [Gammaproteobacteria bacterium]|nr:AmmeMemoRadiSam system protein B [Gammaproteobacteria bacterium]